MARTQQASKIAWILAMLVTWIATGLAPAAATPVKEAPWHPLAAAYRTTMFFAELDPVPWSNIAEVWRNLPPGIAGDGPAPIGKIEAAIEAKDTHAVFEQSTRLIAEKIVRSLSAAEIALGGDGVQLRLQEARALYRALEDGIAATDPDAHQAIGRAWLELTSSAGARGVLGAGKVAADPERFATARETIADYVTLNFNPVQFRKRHRLSPLPESAVRHSLPGTIAPFLPPGSFIGDQTPLPRLVLRFEELGIDETDLPMVAFGDMLFDSPQIFGEPARSLGIACSTCHNRSDINRDFFIPGISHQPGAVDVDGSFFNALFNDRRDDPIDIPSLRGLRFTGPYGRDGRFASLRDFTRNVIVNEFGGAEPTPFMLDALVMYMVEFDFLPNSKITPDGRLTEAAGEAARRGEQIFKRPYAAMDGKSCAGCHIPSANFLDRRAHDIGSDTGGYDGARGGAFDTPTLLGSRFTAPYFHDGSLPSLAAVVGWFDDRFDLGLSADERRDLTAYLEAIGDADEAYEAFDDRHTPFRLVFEELTTFASTLDTLIPRRDAFHSRLMIDTVAADLALDASAMSNLEAKPEVYALAGILSAIGTAIGTDDWAEAERLWANFKDRQASLDERMF